MPIPEEYSRRRTADELLCLTPAAIREFRPRPLHELAAEVGARRASEARRRLAGLSPDERRQRLRRDWGRLLGDVEPVADPKVRRLAKETTEHATVERIALEVGRGVVVPVLLLVPPPGRGHVRPWCWGSAQEGKQAFLDQRSEPIAEWLGGGAAVCLVDVRGTGETRPRDGSRRHNGASAALSEAEWMLGQTLVGSRLRDVRSVLRYLRTRADLDAGRVALWGDSFAPANPEGRDLAVPLDADPFPHQAEPLGGLLALFAALFEDGVRAVYVRGGLTGFESLLQSPFFYVPHDALIPGALTAGDLCDVAAALAPRPLRMEGLVDGLEPRGRAPSRWPGSWSRPGRPTARWTPGPASSSARAMRRALRPPAGSWGRCSRNPPRGGTVIASDVLPAYAFKAARVRLTRSLSRSAEPGRRSRLEAR